MSSLERRCRWLLRAYPAWYRCRRGEEMLGTLLEASPPGRSWPSFRDARALVIGGLRVRGRTWLLSLLWVGLGAADAGYLFYVTTKPLSWADVAASAGTEASIAGPVPVQIAAVLAGVALLALPLPVLIAGFIRLRGWRPANWLRAAAWAGVWIAGAALIAKASAWSAYPYASCPNSDQNGLACPIPSPAVVSWGELAICAAWLVLGAVMTWILAGPGRRSQVPDPTSARCSGRPGRLRRWTSISR